MLKAKENCCCSRLSFTTFNNEINLILKNKNLTLQFFDKIVFHLIETQNVEKVLNFVMMTEYS